AGSSPVRLGPALFKVQPCLTWRCIRHANWMPSDWQAWQRTAWSCVTCLEVAEDGQALELVLEELCGERESRSPRSSLELEAGGKDLEAPQSSARTETLSWRRRRRL
ncbi:unnamed protein product, partial [Effrenium voratum]